MDISEKVMLSESAVDRWHNTAQKAAEKLKDRYVPEDIPDEEIHAQEDGSLLIVLKLTNYNITMRVEIEEWSWIN